LRIEKGLFGQMRPKLTGQGQMEGSGYENRHVRALLIERFKEQ